MPYRAELKRPDLKGTFRCSICQKIFCHSSSLSRHRMQAHFKSYTCTICNKEITSWYNCQYLLAHDLINSNRNETLRAHMYKQHQISRMFMCRCCNWAFPDKTSLHMHMQTIQAAKGTVGSSGSSNGSAPPSVSTNSQQQSTAHDLFNHISTISSLAAMSNNNNNVPHSHPFNGLNGQSNGGSPLQQQQPVVSQHYVSSPTVLHQQQQQPTSAHQQQSVLSAAHHTSTADSAQHGNSTQHHTSITNTLHNGAGVFPGGLGGIGGGLAGIAPFLRASAADPNVAALGGNNNNSSSNNTQQLQQLLKLRERMLLGGQLGSSGFNLAAWLAGLQQQQQQQQQQQKQHQQQPQEAAANLLMQSLRAVKTNNGVLSTHNASNVIQPSPDADHPSNMDTLDAKDFGKCDTSSVTGPSSPTLPATNSGQTSDHEHHDDEDDEIVDVEEAHTATSPPTTSESGGSGSGTGKASDSPRHHSEQPSSTVDDDIKHELDSQNWSSSLPNQMDTSEGEDKPQPQQQPEHHVSRPTAVEHPSLASFASLMPNLRSAIESSPLNSLLYKKKFEALTRAAALANQHHHHDHQQQQQPSAGSPFCMQSAAASASLETEERLHISPSDTTGSSSPSHGCFECQLYRGKLALAENRTKFLEDKAANLQQEAMRGKSRVASLANTNRQLDDECRVLRAQNDSLQRKLLTCQEKAVTLIQTGAAGGEALLHQALTDILHATFVA